MFIKFDTESGKRSFSFEGESSDEYWEEWFFNILKDEYAAAVNQIRDGQWEVIIENHKMEYFNDDLMPEALYASDPSANDLIEKIGLDLAERLKKEADSQENEQS